MDSPHGYIISDIHCQEMRRGLPFFGALVHVWNTESLLASDEERDYEISTEMVDYWTDFMKYGTPDRSGDIWKPYRENDKYIKEFR